VAYSPDWLHQNTGLPTEYAVPRTTRLQNLENQYWHEHQLVFRPFSVDQAMITHILAHYSGTE